MINFSSLQTRRLIHNFCHKLWILPLFCLFSLQPIKAQEHDASPFFPTWKLLSQDQKQQFISGYIHGWQDAEKITDAAIDFVRENPKQALEGLKQIKSIYDMAGFDPQNMAKQVDQFFSKPDNQGASLPQALSHARAALR